MSALVNADDAAEASMRFDSRPSKGVKEEGRRVMSTC